MTRDEVADLERDIRRVIDREHEGRYEHRKKYVEEVDALDVLNRTLEALKELPCVR